MIKRFDMIESGSIFSYKGETLEKVSFAHGKDCKGVIRFVSYKAYICLIKA